NMAGAAVTSLAVWVASSWRPSRHFSFGDVRAVMGFSANLSAFIVFNFFLLNGDKVIVGRFLGAAALGHYGLAQRVLMYPVTSVSAALQEVMFAGLSRVQDDHAAFRSIYFRACAATALICFPVMALLAVVAEDAVLVVLGEDWRPLVALVWILAPIGGLQSVTFSVGVIYNAKGRTDLLLRWGVFSGSLMLGSYFAGLPWGVNGVAAAYAVTILLLIAPGFMIPFRLIDARLRDLVAAVWPQLWTSLAMAAAVAAVQYAAHEGGLPRPASLAISVATGVAVTVLRRFASRGKAPSAAVAPAGPDLAPAPRGAQL
nr:oligosaccharide flippase family protein [Micromonospora sp. DSM 115978]